MPRRLVLPIVSVSLLSVPLLLGWGAASPLRAQTPRAATPELAAKAIVPADTARPRGLPVASLPEEAAAAARATLTGLGIEAGHTLVDTVSGRVSTVLLSRPLIAGRDNAPSGASGGPAGPRTPSDPEALGEAAWKAVVGEVARLREVLGVDEDELGAPRIAVHEQGATIQITARREVAGVPVRGATLHAVLSGGNLVLLGTTRWSPVRESAAATLARPAARRSLARHLAPFRVAEIVEAERLELVPLAPTPGAPTGAGYRHRLVWTLGARIDGDPGLWRASIDAHTGRVVELVDTQLYESARTVTGGVLPVSNDGIDPSGIEQLATPMPFLDVSTSIGVRTTDSGGNLPVCVDGEISTSLTGPFAAMVDVCGEISEASSSDLDLGSSAGTNCSVPADGSLGNTRSARSVYHHLDRMRQTALGLLDDNTWLRTQVPAITNFPSELLLGCNAFWDGSGVLFTTDSAGLCANPGELAGVVQHEWGHGLDDNDANGVVSNPPEGIADVFTSLRQADSCIGRGFFLGTPCDTGDGDPCTTCDGVRDVDWAARSSNTPHDIEFIGGSCPAPLGVTGGPCGRAVHCEGAVVSESVWDLVHRDLAAAPYDLDFHTAQEVVSRIVYQGSGVVGDWYACTPEDPFEATPASGDGCNVDGGYLNLLAIDDDNGDLTDGTPHMEAIHAAFDRHGIACPVPTPIDSGCASAPSTAPSLVATPGDRVVALSWSAVTDAESYSIYRSEGPLGCDVGKIEVGRTTETTFLDQGLLNGRDAHYVVIPVGDSPSCSGPASACVTATPAAGANLTPDPASLDVGLSGGDLDGALDNCETATLTFDVSNLGVVPLTGVAVLDVAVVEPEAGTTIVSSLPLAVAESLVPCGTAAATIDVLAGGLTFGGSLVLEVRLIADQLAQPRSVRLRVDTTEIDVVATSSRTFDFEADFDGWELVQGTFARTGGGGADGTDVHVASSSQTNEQCDQIRSPLMRLTPSSTVSLSTSLDVEPVFEDPALPGVQFWFDRANLAVTDVAAGTRTTLTPDGGRLYNADGSYGSCVTEGQPGWADEQTAWAQSTFSAAAVDGGRWPSRLVRIDLAYGTDADLAGDGFRFDQVTVTDLELVTPDSQSDVCAPNTEPDAVDDDRTLLSLGAMEIDVLTNDLDDDEDPLRVDSTTAPTLGTVQVLAHGPGLDAVGYERVGCATGVDTFDYTVADGRGGFDTATVIVDSTGLAERSAPDLVLSSRAVTGDEAFEGCLSLTAGDGFVVEDGGAATLWSGGAVVLGNGFSVSMGGSLVVVTGELP